MTNRKIPLTTPGDSLREMLDELGVSAYAFAKAIGKAPIQVTRILNGASSITPEMSLRMGKALGMSPGYWHRLQADYDMRLVLQRDSEINVEPLDAVM
jgi:addiction module HigA family antidote